MSGFKRSFRRLVLAASAALVATSAFAGEKRPVPAAIIYPGDIIRDQMLIDAPVNDAQAGSAYAANRDLLVGKAAKRTLLPGYPIPLSAIGVPRLVSIGAMVRLVYEEGGLEISTHAAALQNGAAGDVISVRNLESGVTLSGVIKPDGSVHVGPG